MSSLQSVLRAPDYAWRTPPTYSGSSDSQSPYPSSSSSSSPSSSASSQRVKRSIPCDLCQSRKAKCDRQRPKCSMCVRRNLACNYSVRRKITISSRDMESGGITRVLDALSSDQAAELFQALCARGYDAALSRPRQISERETLRALLPATETQAEFELTTRHPIAYPVLVPLLADDLPLHSILRAKRTPLHRFDLDIDHLSSSYGRDSPTGGTQRALAGPEFNLSLSPDLDGCSAVVMPPSFLSRPLFRERLRDVDIAAWTTVQIPNELAIRLISIYFDTEYEVMPSVEVDLFVEDLACGRHWFCSSMLVNAILAWSCQIYTPLSQAMPDLAFAFYNEALKLNSQMKQRNTLTTVAALQVLIMASITNGQLDLADKCTKEAVKIGKQMGLFGVRYRCESAHSWLNGHLEWRRAASYTAWGTFNWVVLHNMHYHVVDIEVPPLLPMPGEVERLDGGAKDGSVDKIAQHAEVFDRTCELRIIMNDIMWKYFGDPRGLPPERITVAVAASLYQRLLKWAEDLPLSMARSEQSSQGIMIMHIHFHALVTDIFRMFLATPSGSETLSLMASPDATPQAIYTASVNQLKRLLLIYRLKYKPSTLSVFWHTSAMYTANAVVNDARTAPPMKRVGGSPEWHFYFDLCIAALEDLSASYPAFCSATKGVLAVALRDNAISNVKARRIARDIEEIEAQYDKINSRRTIAAGWIIDLELGMTNPELAAGGSLAEQLKQLSLDDDSEA